MSAQIISFPHWPVRAIVVREIAPGQWQGRFQLDGEPRFRTEIGRREQVVNALVRSDERCGLPIVIVDAGYAGQWRESAA